MVEIGCNDLYGQSCEGAGYCCKDEIPTTTIPTTASTSTVSNKPTTSTDANIDCKSLCNGADTGNIGDCCSSFYCDCASQQVVHCDEGDKFCNKDGYDGCAYIGNQQSCDAVDYCCDDENKRNNESTNQKKVQEDDCILFCSGQDAGLNGACCNDYYCDCETNSPHYCPDDQVFCDKLGGCTDLFGQDCNGLDFCCNPKPPNVCEAICEESGSLMAGECCGDSFCDCQSLSQHNCDQNEVFCTLLDSCVDLFGQSCEDLGWCCGE